MSQRIKCITLWQPWASLMFCGKMFETRSWKTAVRGRIYIHAAVTLQGIKEVMSWPAHLQDDRVAIENALKTIGIENWLNDLPRGKILGHGHLRDCIPAQQAADELPMQRPFGDFSPGRWAHHYVHATRLKEPIEAKGKQGFWWHDMEGGEE